MSEVPTLTIDEFWDLIHRSKNETEGKLERAKWLRSMLATRPVGEIADFHWWLSVAKQRVNTWDMYSAFSGIFLVGSADSFDYFLSWLIGLGREVFEEVAMRPDSLIHLPAIERLLQLQLDWVRSGGELPVWTREDEPYFYQLGGMARKLYLALTDDDFDGLEAKLDAYGVTYSIADPEGERWEPSDPDEMAVRLPGIYRYMKHYQQLLE
ncbi:DUF4240 domain-containing protein [Nonomuraea sp. NPDC048826]|uniref:DUF4240 domain-containing protein n=1 Tax=Nonomuraea sp. NPDC048826 TaxID=3364347 RepID=UPI0037176F85